MGFCMPSIGVSGVDVVVRGDHSPGVMLIVGPVLSYCCRFVCGGGLSQGPRSMAKKSRLRKIR